MIKLLFHATRERLKYNSKFETTAEHNFKPTLGCFLSAFNASDQIGSRVSHRIIFRTAIELKESIHYPKLFLEALSENINSLFYYEIVEGQNEAFPNRIGISTCLIATRQRFQ